MTPSSPSLPSASGTRSPAPPAAAYIRTENLVKTYGERTVVNGVNIQIQAGEVVGLLGPNGAGKTTTFYMIVGLVPPTQGTVILNGQDATHLRMHERARHGLGYLAQESSIFRQLTVEENILAIVQTIGLPKNQHRARVHQHLEELHLTHVSKQKAITLSGGERRRLEIARALVTNPKFLLMDEPFAGVDPINVAEVQKMIQALKARGIGVLITDHQVRETLRSVDRAYIMAKGRVLTSGTADHLVNDPQAREHYLGKDFNL